MRKACGQKWRHFVHQGLSAYAERRNLLTDDTTSRMSPYIRCGLISLRQMVQEAMAVSEAFLRELAWHDFYAHLLHHFPETSETEWKSEWRGFPWRKDERVFESLVSRANGHPVGGCGNASVATGRLATQSRSDGRRQFPDEAFAN
jgi:deoxyribodipyrimidine photolyase